MPVVVWPAAVFGDNGAALIRPALLAFGFVSLGILLLVTLFLTLRFHARLRRELALRLSTEQALGDIEERARLILNAVDEGVFGLDRAGHTTFVNPAAARMVGYRHDELIGRPIHDVVHHSHADGRPYPPDQCPMLHTTRDGRDRRIRDEVFWRKDGSAFQVSYVSSALHKGERWSVP